MRVRPFRVLRLRQELVGRVAAPRWSRRSRVIATPSVHRLNALPVSS